MLWTVTLTIINSGETGIKIGDFDPKAPLGIEVKDGAIVDNPKYLTSNDYLQNALELIISKEKIIFAPIIIEPKDYININFLILGSENIQPNAYSYLKEPLRIAAKKPPKTVSKRPPIIT